MKVEYIRHDDYVVAIVKNYTLDELHTFNSNGWKLTGTYRSCLTFEKNI